MYYIDVKTLQEVLNFLGTCRYQDVANLIPKLLQLRKLEEEKGEE